MRKLRDIMLGFVFLFCLAYECANMTWAGVAVRAVIIVAVTLVLMHSSMLEEKEREEKEERGVKPKVGLHVKTVTGAEFDVVGTVTYVDFPEDGRIFYCAGRSFPAEIVTEIYGTAEVA